jgi:hypothetical protein
MYEKELTITSSTALLNSQQQQQRSRMESLEKTVEGYRELVERLEADLENAVKGLGNHIHHYNSIHSPPPVTFEDISPPKLRALYPSGK